MTLGPQDLVFRSRALAQTHPLSEVAKRFVDKVVGEQRASQPVPEIGIWAGAAMINGYCLRRVEEEEAGVPFEAPGEEPSFEELEERASGIAAEVRTDDARRYLLGDDERTVAALDRLIGGEVERRVDHWRDSIDDNAVAELEEYLTWWTVKGYALRIAESATWARS